MSFYNDLIYGRQILLYQIELCENIPYPAKK